MNELIDSLKALENSLKQIIRRNFMKTLYAIVLLAFVGLAILGCTDLSDQLVTPVEKASTLNSSGSLDKGNGILHSVTGSAHWKIVSGTGQSRVRFSFSAIQHANGECTGEVQNNDEGPTFNFHGKVFDLKVEENFAKFAFKFTSGTYYGIPLEDWYGGDISKLTAWCVVIDNGKGATTSGPDVASWILWTDGSDIGTGTIEELNTLGPQAYLDWIENYLAPMYGFPFEDFLPQIQNGNITVR